MKVVGNIASDSEVVATASGAITAGKPVIVNSNGTVTSTLEVTDSDTQALGTEITFESAHANTLSGVFDSSNNKVIIAYNDVGYASYRTVVVCTINSNGTMSKGTPVIYASHGVTNADIAYVGSGKIVALYRDSSNNQGYAVVGTVSGTSISFGSATAYTTNAPQNPKVEYDSNADRVLIAFRDSSDGDKGKSVVGTVSGTSISFGSIVTFENAATGATIALAFDSNANKMAINYVDAANSSYGTAIVGTISGTSVSYGSAVVYFSGSTADTGAVFDSTNNKVVFAYEDAVVSGREGKALVGTISGTSISFGSAATFTSSASYHEESGFSMAYDTNAKKIVIVYNDEADGYDGEFVVATVSGTSISFSSSTDFETDPVEHQVVVFDSNLNKLAIAWRDGGSSYYGKIRSLQLAYNNTVTSITTENFIGFAKDNVADGAVATIQTANSIARDNIGEAPTLSAGSAAVYESATAADNNIAFVPSANKFVIVYRDEGNSSYGTALVATISGTSVTYGSATVFNSDYVGNLDITVDTNVDRIAISYTSSTSSNTGKMIIGAVSGTSLSFGSAADFNNNTVSTGVAFDSSNNKVVVAYEDDANSDYTAARVATIDSSDNSVTFGTEVNVEEANTAYQRIVFDSNSSKVVVIYRHYDGSAYSGRAKVGTVSGTNISFGSSTTFHSGNFSQPDIEFDSSNNKVVIVYANEASSAVGTAIVGTVSGTSISFGSAVVFNNGDTSTMGLTFDTTQNHFVIAYRDQGDSNKANAIIGTVDGTSISFGTEASLTSGAALYIKCAYDSNADKVLVSYQDGANSDYGTAVVATASTDLTIGQTYFVQTDGTLSTSADDPSVIAGTAISGTDLIVKG